MEGNKSGRGGTDDAEVSSWIISGTSRSGKSTMVAAINDGESAIAGLPVEGLLPVYYYRKYLRPRQQLRRVLEEYLERPRLTDPSSGTVARPLDFFSSSLDDILREFPDKFLHQLEAIDWALSRFAEERGRKTWAACDVNPEMLYEKLLRHLPNLSMCVMIRDPLETLAATMHWREFPKRVPHDWAVLRLELLRWMLSVQTATRLTNRFKDRVAVLSFNELVDGGNKANDFSRRVFGVRGEDYLARAGGTPWFSRSGNSFTCPDGTIRELLREEEVALIRRATASLLRRAGFSADAFCPVGVRHSDLAFLVFVRVVMWSAAIWPEGTKVVSDFIFSPKRVLIRRMRIVKGFFFDNFVSVMRSRRA